METKDWLTIFIPLLFNGIIFFGLQLIITRHLDKKMNYKNETLRQCLNLIQQTYELSLNIDLLDPNISGKDNTNFSDIWNPFNESVNKLSDFIKTHPNVISINDFGLDIFFEKVSNIRKILYNYRINNNNILSDNAFREVYKTLKLAQKYLEKSTDFCEKRILKI